MDTRHSVTRCLRECGLDLRSAVRSRRRGRLDAARLRMTASAYDPDSSELITPYVQEVRLIAERATIELRGRLIEDRHTLVAAIHSGAVPVVVQYEERRSDSPALLDRWGRSVAEWRTAAALCRTRAESIAGGANLRLAHYWDAVWQRQSALDEDPRTRPQDWLPGRITLDADWNEPDSWLTAAPGAPSVLTTALRVLDGGHARAGRPAT
ncbi:hypothetical protein OHB35_13585 [Streptomyces phaeochromogenes]|uniref:Uncharacterized protein n=1 Tax=Streptomyces phaeochromogenes TaxID=1923 RepID=A0ABZ1HAJ9_STRPH|nr:hypothetical protein [Streptomyces phaeochromogenes]WSD14194.1 hypothetical protein OHB35_13585 [Streptomyces phaeochromogenes]